MNTKLYYYIEGLSKHKGNYSYKNIVQSSSH